MGLNELTIEELKSMLSSHEITTGEIIHDLGEAIDGDSRNERPLNTYIDFD